MANGKPVRRIGVHVPADGLSRQQTLDLVRRAEELGYESAWAGESWGFDAFTTLAWLAGRTTRIGIGTHIATMFSRTPAMTAQSAASLDSIAGGRLTLGLGTSGPIVVENWHGQRWEQPLRRTREFIEIVRLALSGERVDYDGKVFRLRGFRLRDEPPRSEVPVMLASIGPRNVELTGELAEGWLPIFLRIDALPEMRGLLAAGAARAGRDASTIEIAPAMLAAASERAPEACSGHGAGAHRVLRGRHGDVLQTGCCSVSGGRRRRSASTGSGRARTARGARQPQPPSPTRCWTRRARSGLRRTLGSDWRRRTPQASTLPVLMFPHGADAALIGDTLEALAPSRW